jgi:transposase
MIVNNGVAIAMTKPYSYDLRKKVIEAIELDGFKKTEASQMFNVSRNTINLWLKRKEETGDYKAQKTTPLETTTKIKDWKKFQEFVEDNADKTQVEMAQLWDGEISDRTISRALKKINFTRKKNLWVSRTRRGEKTNISRKNRDIEQ